MHVTFPTVIILSVAAMIAFAGGCKSDEMYALAVMRSGALRTSCFDASESV